MRPSYVDVLFTVFMTFKTGEGGGGGKKIKIVNTLKIKNMLNYYQLIIASTSADVSTDMCADFSGSL